MRSTPLGLLALALVPRVAAATDVWTVGGGGEFASIQAALDTVLPGDRLLVAPGTYTECLTIDFDVDILATGGSGDTTIQCTDNGRPYAVEISAGSWVRMDGFTIDHSGGLGGLRSTGGSQVVLNDVAMSDLTSTTGAGCIDADSGSMRVHDATLTRCFGTSGGAVRVSGSGATLGLVGTTIEGGDASQNGGGVYFLGGTFYASSSTIGSSVAANYGGGLYLVASGGGQGAKLTDVVVEDCVSESTGGSGNGGGIYTSMALVGIDVTLRRNEARSTTTYSGGEGGGLYGANTVTLVRGEISGNSGFFYGGGLHNTGSATLYGTRVAGNSVGDATRYGYGGGLSAFGTLTTHGTTIESNTSTNYGGGVYAGNWTSRDDVVASNAAIPAVLGAASAYGGGAFVNNLDARWTRFSDNVAAGVSGGSGFGGGAYVQGPLYLEGTRWARNGSNTTHTTHFGGAIYATGSGTQTYRTSYFDTNKAATGGAVHLSPNALATIEGSEFQSNQATAGNGGALFQSRASLSSGIYVLAVESFFRDNSAVDGSGGAIFVNNTGFEANTSWFTRNTASDPAPATIGAGRGGAIFFAGGERAYATKSLFCKNSSAGYGGALFGATVPNFTEFDYSVFQENAATGTGARGGAYWEDSRASTGAVTYSIASTFAGNTSAAAGYGGFAGGATARLYSSQSTFQNNGTTAIRNDNATAGTLWVYSSDFSGHSSAAYSSVGGSVNQNDNLIDATTNNPPLTGWVVNANCFDDDLTDRWRSSGASILTENYTDLDGDGATVMQRDCDHQNGQIWPGATEIRGNGSDDDCFMGENPDGDEDGYAPNWLGGADCSEGADWINPDAFDDSATPWEDEDCVLGTEHDSDGDGLAYPADCDHGDPLRNDFVAEVPYDGVQQTCATSDFDADLDGGDRAGSGNGWDCDDTTDTLGPFVHEVPYDGIDQNCDGRSDFDADMDGVDSNAFGGTDCDDDDATRSPANPEIYYDGLDSNCVDDNDYDADGDGFVATAYNAFAGGTATGTGDCDDTNPNTYPGAHEITDGLDNTCDGVHNPDPDLDGDGVLDNWEVMFGTMPNVIDTDGDGISDGDEWGGDEQNPSNVDGDGEIDALDLDADGDSVFDAYEGTVDSDGDGTFDAQDPDDDGDGIPSSVETDGLGRDGAPDTDKDGTPDWLDLDADNDGALDLSEGTADVDGDGLGAWRDDGKVGDGADQIPDGPEKYGFGGGACSSAPATPSLAGWLVGLGLLFVRRRAR